MRDFPIFSTDYGVASLVLKEIPYKNEAYICIRDVQPEGLDELLKECVSFCRMAGADRVYASGHDALDAYPHYTTVVEMCADIKVAPEDMAQLFPVTEQTVKRWREIYNQSMRHVHNSGTLETRDEKRILESGGAYFVHMDGMLLGIGWIQDQRLLAIASVIPGEGERVLKTLLSLCDEETIYLEVASTNLRAVRLYEKMGFIATKEVSRWYNVG
jgi:hypothetical protein